MVGGVYLFMYFVGKRFFLGMGKFIVCFFILAFIVFYILPKLTGESFFFKENQYQMQDRKYQEPLRV